MNLDHYTAEQIAAHEKELLARIPSDATVGNVMLRSELGWSKSHYWDIRNYLIDRGVLASGRGKGGSVRLVPQAITETTATLSAPALEAATAGLSEADAICAKYPDESHLYQPMSKAIENGWAQDHRLDSVIVAITAQQGSRPAGKWTRPDITVASFQTFPYVAGRHFDVTTFEVKPHDQVNVSAVYEALAHLRAATRSYILLHVPQFAKASLERDIEEAIVTIIFC